MYVITWKSAIISSPSISSDALPCAAAAGCAGRAAAEALPARPPRPGAPGAPPPTLPRDHPAPACSLSAAHCARLYAMERSTFPVHSFSSRTDSIDTFSTSRSPTASAVVGGGGGPAPAASSMNCFALTIRQRTLSWQSRTYASLPRITCRAATASRARLESRAYSVSTPSSPSADASPPCCCCCCCCLPPPPRLL